MKIKREFTKSFLVDDLELPYDGYISKKIIDTSRWSIHYELVFQFEDKFYLTYYSEGATEQQDECAWEYDDIVVCFEVIPVEQTVTNYVCVEANCE